MCRWVSLNCDQLFSTQLFNEAARIGNASDHKLTFPLKRFSRKFTMTSIVWSIMMNQIGYLLSFQFKLFSEYFDFASIFASLVWLSCHHHISRKRILPRRRQLFLTRLRLPHNSIFYSAVCYHAAHKTEVVSCLIHYLSNFSRYRRKHMIKVWRHGVPCQLSGFKVISLKCRKRFVKHQHVNKYTSMSPSMLFQSSKSWCSDA